MKTIMIVEDNAIIAMNEAEVLNDYGYNVITATTGEEAIAICRRGDEVDLILMDIDLGSGMNGPQTAQIILAERTLPIVFLTMHAEREMVEKVRGITRYGYVIKNSGDFVLKSSIEMAFDLFEAHQKADEQSSRNAALLRGLPDLLFVIDRTGNYLEVYTPDDALLSMPKEEIIGKSLYEIFSKDEADRFLTVFDRCFQTGETQSFEYEIELLGEKKQYEARVTIYDENSVLAIARDITERKSTEAKLRESEEKYRHLFQNAPAAIFEVDYLTHRFAKVNSIMCERSGYTEEEFLEMQYPDLIMEDSKALFSERMDALLSGQTVSQKAEYRIKDMNGRIRWMEFINKFIWNDGRITGSAIVGYDITARKQVEEELLSTKSELEGMLKALPDLMFEVNQDGRFINFYAEDKLLLYASVDQIIGRTVDELIPSDAATVIMEAIREADEKGTSKGCSYTLTIEGGVFWFELSISKKPAVKGKEHHFICLARDITARKRSEELLRESEAKYRQLFYNAPAAIYEIDFVTQRFTKVNSVMCEYSGYSEEELLSMNPLELMTEESKSHFLSRIEKMLTSQPVTEETEYCMMDRNGRIRWLVLNNEFLRKDGLITGAAVVAHDVTERRKMEESIKELLAEKEVLLHEVHHRIKNNMTTVKSLLNLQARAVKNEEASQAIRDAAGRMQSMETLYDKLYRTDSFRDLNMKEFLPPLITEILEVFPDNIQVSTDIRVEDIVVSPKILLPLGIIINELITNSMRYAFKGAESSLITVSAAKTGNTVTIIYSDNGIGLPESITVGNSAGFGMKLVGMMVKQMQGAITIERGEGTKFVIEVPV